MRLTVLGLRGVPETIREAAIAYGATKWYLLEKVDLPLATPSILAGVNQTVMFKFSNGGCSISNWCKRFGTRCS